jgi:hypothetical protein
MDIKDNEVKHKTLSSSIKCDDKYHFLDFSYVLPFVYHISFLNIEKDKRKARFNEEIKVNECRWEGSHTDTLLNLYS